MTNLPPQDRKWLLEHGHKDIVDREGDYSQYEAEIQQLIHTNDKKPGNQPVQQQPVQKTEQSRKEDKAQQRIVELGEEYSDISKANLSKEDKQVLEGHRAEMMDDLEESEKNPTIVPNFDLEKLEDEKPDIPLPIKLHWDDGSVTIDDGPYAGSHYGSKDEYLHDESKVKLAGKQPLHIQSLEKQVAKNPDYKKIADSLTDDKETNEAFFYAFKDAYEKHNYEPSNKHIANELSNRYWALADSYRDRYGMSDGEWDESGSYDFEEKYGTEADFIDKGLEAHDKYFDELGGPEPSIFEQGLKNLNISYDNELLSKINSMSDKEQNKLLKYMMTEIYNPGFGKNKEKLQEMLKGLE